MDIRDDTEDIAARADWGGDSESMADVLRDTQVEAEAAALDEMAEAKGGGVWPEDAGGPLHATSRADAIPTDPRKAQVPEVKREVEEAGLRGADKGAEAAGEHAGWEKNGSGRRRDTGGERRRDDGERDRKERRRRDRSDSAEEQRRRRHSRSRSSRADSYRERRYSERESPYASRDQDRERDREHRDPRDPRDRKDSRERDESRDRAYSGKEEADRLRSGGWVDKPEEDWHMERGGHPGHANPAPKRAFGSASNIFHGLTLFVLPQRRGLPKDPISPLELIKAHGGRLCPDPSADRCDFIVIPYNPALPKDIVAHVDLHRSHTIDEMLSVRDWKSENMVRYFARTVGEVPPYERRMPKIVLRQDWLHACIEADRILGEEDGWGGFEVRASYDPSLAFGPPPNQLNGKSNGQSFSDSNRVPIQLRAGGGGVAADQMGSNGRDGPGRFDARVDEGRGGPTWGKRPSNDGFQRSQPNPPPPNASAWQQPSPSDPRLQQRNPSGPGLGAPPPFARPPPASAPPQQDIFSPAPPRSASGFGGHPPPPGASGPGPAPAGAGMVAYPGRQAAGVTEAQGAGAGAGLQPLAGKLFSFAGVLPIGFYVEGTPAARKPVEMLIARDGGGVITTPDRASIVVLPLSKDQPPTDASHLQLIRQLAPPEPGRTIISQDWVFDSLEAGTLAPLLEYAVPVPAPAPGVAGVAGAAGAAGAAGVGSAGGVGGVGGAGQGWRGYGNGNGNDHARYDPPTMPGVRSFSDSVGPPGFAVSAGRGGAPAPAGVSGRGAGAEPWGRKRAGEEVERDAKRRDEGRGEQQPIPFPQMDAPAGFVDVDPVHQVPMGMLVDGLRRWDPRSEWAGLLESLAVYPEDKHESAKQARYIDNILNLYPRTLERSVPGLNYRQLMNVWKRNVGSLLVREDEFL